MSSSEGNTSDISIHVGDERRSASRLTDEESSNHDDKSARVNETTYLGDNHRASVIRDSRPAYDYRHYLPTSRNVADLAQWLVSGFVPDGKATKLSEVEVEEGTRQAARMLSLLREYERRFGMPEAGDSRDQQYVLTELCRGLYGGGTPLWTLKPAMSQAAQGLTGARGVEFSLFPRTAFVFAPTSGSTLMFNMDRGFRIQMLTLMERVLVRLSSFASNTRSVHSVETIHPPQVSDLLRACRGESVQFGRGYRKDALAKEILDLASDGVGLFYLTSHAEQMQLKAMHAHNNLSANATEIQTFWTVEPSIKELFTRLATIEADRAIDAIKEEMAARPLYPRPVYLLFRIISSAGAAGLWFSASWLDTIVAGFLGLVVALFEGATLWKHERMILEVLASWVVGLAAGLLSLSFPSHLCFGGMAVGAVVDILQGFRVVYSIMEIMSKHTVAGGADFLEALLFTGLIAYFLKFGFASAKGMLGIDEFDEVDFSSCGNPISSYFYFLLVPLTSLAWSVLFTPHYADLPLMTLHGVLSYVIYWAVSTASGNGALATFIGAMSVTASAGIVSRFSGRQALGDTVTGLYVLLPGAYLAKGLFKAAEKNVIDSALLSSIVVMAVTIGLGGWTGSILVSPTILGTNRGLLKKQAASKAKDVRRRSSRDAENLAATMLFF